eukprot:SAG25_NODE_46_length_19040_cov_20.665699_13_plen_92_part_00
MLSIALPPVAAFTWHGDTYIHVPGPTHSSPAAHQPVSISSSAHIIAHLCLTLGPRSPGVARSCKRRVSQAASIAMASPICGLYKTVHNSYY